MKQERSSAEIPFTHPLTRLRGETRLERPLTSGKNTSCMAHTSTAENQTTLGVRPSAARESSASLSGLGLAAALGLSLMLTTGSARPAPAADRGRTARGLGSISIHSQRAARAGPRRRCRAVTLGGSTTGIALWTGYHGAREPRAASIAGALVPDTPFELEWQTDGCRPFGAHGPRFDGWVKLTVFREDWGFSALVEPSGLRVTLTENETTLIQPGAASLPQCVEADEPVELTLSTHTGHYRAVDHSSPGELDVAVAHLDAALGLLVVRPAHRRALRPAAAASVALPCRHAHRTFAL